jgi:tol-pal system protein YbgF
MGFLRSRQGIIMKLTLLIITGFFLVGILGGCVQEDSILILDDRLATQEKRSADIKRTNSDLADRIIELEARTINLENENAALSGQIEQALSTDTEQLLAAQIEQFDQKVTQDDQALRDHSASLYIQLEELRAEIQTLSGKIEEIEFLLPQRAEAINEVDQKLVRNMTRIDELIQQNSNRLQAIEKYLTAAQEAKKQVKPKVEQPKPKAETAKLDQLSETELYATAKRAFDNGDYITARQYFQKQLKKFPQSNRADNAQFWIGETYYREKWYEKAILEYDNVINNYPKGNKVPAALYKQALAFIHVDNIPLARVRLKELIEKYPDATESGLARKKLEGL